MQNANKANRRKGESERIFEQEREKETAKEKEWAREAEAKKQSKSNCQFAYENIPWKRQKRRMQLQLYQHMVEESQVWVSVWVNVCVELHSMRC